MAAVPSEQREIANRRAQIAITLFYKYIESILQNEQAIQTDISVRVEMILFWFVSKLLYFRRSSRKMYFMNVCLHVV